MSIELIEKMKDSLKSTHPNNPIVKEAEDWIRENDYRINTTGKNKMLYIGGGRTSFHCDCGCNVFQNMVTDSTKYVCNSCQTVFIGK